MTFRANHPGLRRWCARLAVAASTATLLATLVLWSLYLVRDDFDFGFYSRPYASGEGWMFAIAHYSDSGPFAGYSVWSDRPRSPVQGPLYGTPDYPAWEKQIRQSDRVLDVGGFYFCRWSLIAISEDAATLEGVEYDAEVPFWFVCAASIPLPLWWLRRRVRGRRRAAAGQCLGCGYDLRASVGRCPECGRTL